MCSGMPLIHLRTRFCDYRFELTQKYNLLTGDSGTGKTELSNTIEAYMLDPASIVCDEYRKITTDNHLSIQDILELKDYVVVLDEDSPLLHRADTATILEKSENYFLIICRDIGLGFKSVSLDAVFKMKASGKYHTFEKAYNVNPEMFPVNQIVCEDSKSGMQFLREVFCDKLSVDYAKSSESDKTGGKSKIANYLLGIQSGTGVCVAFDKSAIAYDFPRIINAIRIQGLQVCFIDWDSFECYVLESPLFHSEVPEPENMWESKEELATDMIEKLIPYQKSSLSKCLKQGSCKSCKENDCQHKHYNSNLLIYWKVRQLEEIMDRENKKLSKQHKSGREVAVVNQDKNLYEYYKFDDLKDKLKTLNAITAFK